MGEADGFCQVVYFLVLYDMDAVGILFTKTGRRLDAEDEAVKLFAENGRLPRLRNYKVLSFVLIPFFFQVYNPAAASMA